MANRPRRCGKLQPGRHEGGNSELRRRLKRAWARGKVPIWLMIHTDAEAHVLNQTDLARERRKILLAERAKAGNPRGKNVRRLEAKRRQVGQSLGLW